MLESPADLIVRCRRLLRVMRDLGMDGYEELGVFRVVDSEADAWPIGVEVSLLDSTYRSKCADEEMHYSQEVWPAIQMGCRAVLALLAKHNESQ